MQNWKKKKKGLKVIQKEKYFFYVVKFKAL